LHVDGTCEAGTDVLFAALAGPRGWVLEVGKMTTENTLAISQVVGRCVERFGEPLAVVRDLSHNIKNAIQEVLPETLDLICQYHFLENQYCVRMVECAEALCKSRYTNAGWTKKGEICQRKQFCT